MPFLHIHTHTNPRLVLCACAQFVASSLHDCQPLSVTHSAFLTCAPRGEELYKGVKPVLFSNSSPAVALYSSLDATASYRLDARGRWYTGQGDEVSGGCCVVGWRGCAV